MFIKIKIFFFLILIIIPNLVNANACLHAIHKISSQTIIPKDVLTAVALTETGTSQYGKMAPYPWAVNIDGKGYFFKSKQKAVDTVEKFLAEGKTSIDIGCMQMNWRWHGHKFDHSVAKAFDPISNIRVGASYIKEHYKAFKNWSKAVGRYHSKTKKYASKYIKNFNRNLRAVHKNPEMMRNVTPTAIASIENDAHKELNKDKAKTKPLYKLTMLNHAPGAIIQFNEYKEGHEIKSNKPNSFLWNLPAAPTPILDTARKRHLFGQ